MKINWNKAPSSGAVWIQFKDSRPKVSGWAYLSADQTKYVFIGLSREYEIKWFQEPNAVGKVYTNPAHSNLVFNESHVHPQDEGSINVDRWKVPSENIYSGEVTAIISEASKVTVLISEWEPDSVEERLLVDIKSSAYMAYEMSLNDQQAYDILERMRSDVEKTFCIPRRLL